MKKKNVNIKTMKTLPNDPAHPTIEEHRDVYISNPPYWVTTAGLTKRETFAMAAMQGMLSAGGCETKTSGKSLNPIKLAYYAVNQADELIKALNETTKIADKPQIKGICETCNLEQIVAHHYGKDICEYCFNDFKEWQASRDK